MSTIVETILLSDHFGKFISADGTLTGYDNLLPTTHIMEEADKLSNHVAFLSRGKLAVTGTPDQLKRSLNRDDVTMEDVFIHYIVLTTVIF